VLTTNRVNLSARENPAGRSTVSGPTWTVDGQGQETVRPKTVGVGRVSGRYVRQLAHVQLLAPDEDCRTLLTAGWRQNAVVRA
jgi:hypothetical protein